MLVDSDILQAVREGDDRIASIVELHQHIAPDRCSILTFATLISIIVFKEVHKMAQATFSVRMDETLKRQFDTLCSDFGMTASTAINVFARAVVRERKIPFEIASPKPEITREKAMQAFMAIRAQSEKNFPQGMTLEEINEEIRKARYGEEDAE